MILVTGANGFLGSWVTSLLNYRGIEWHGLCKKETNFNRLKYLPNSKISFENTESWCDYVYNLRPEILISCDWAGVGNDMRNESELQFSNVDRIFNLALAADRIGVKKFIAFGSQAENGPLNKLALEKNYDLPTTTYGLAKVETRKKLHSVFEGSNTQLIWGRIFSTYGQTDNPQWLIPSLVNSFLNKKVFKLTSGEQDWSYLHAIDFASAALTLCQEDIREEVINIGHPKTVKIRDVATEIALQMRSEEFLDIGAFPTRSDQVFYLKPSVDNLVRYGWAPKIELSYGLTSYINWALKKELSFEGIKLTNFV